MPVKEEYTPSNHLRREPQGVSHTDRALDATPFSTGRFEIISFATLPMAGLASSRFGLGKSQSV